IEREELTFVIPSFPQVSPVPERYWFHTVEGIPTYDYDPQRARELLAEAGHPNGIHIGEMWISEQDNYRRHMEIVQEQLRRAGIQLDLRVVDHTTFHSYQNEKRNPLSLFFALHWDGYLIMERFFVNPDSLLNHAGYSELDEVFLNAGALSLEEMEQIAHWAQRKVVEDLAVYPTIALPRLLARRPQVDLGYDFEASLSLFYRFTPSIRITD